MWNCCSTGQKASPATNPGKAWVPSLTLHLICQALASQERSGKMCLKIADARASSLQVKHEDSRMRPTQREQQTHRSSLPWCQHANWWRRIPSINSGVERVESFCSQDGRRRLSGPGPRQHLVPIILSQSGPCNVSQTSDPYWQDPIMASCW